MLTLPKSYVGLCLMMTVLGYVTKMGLLALGSHLAVATFFGAMLPSFFGGVFCPATWITTKSTHRAKCDFSYARHCGL